MNGFFAVKARSTIRAYDENCSSMFSTLFPDFDDRELIWLVQNYDSNPFADVYIQSPERIVRFESPLLERQDDCTVYDGGVLYELSQQLKDDWSQFVGFFNTSKISTQFLETLLNAGDDDYERFLRIVDEHAEWLFQSIDGAGWHCLSNNDIALGTLRRRAESLENAEVSEIRAMKDIRLHSVDTGE